ncbi:hypoxanthine phosphoribosyltransferase [Acholeplasma equifetale]|uniref:hypoxanthine phosphoribosyltransferase n=1 Tax=Acholeplasma equifetale TaxID=264634 RepID=UPI00047AF726|nr:hypoxanthine phosphoribosyltransferase [Acholeplasma equifetale]
MHNDIKEILLSEDEIATITRQMGAEITKDYKDKKPLVIGLLKGCIPFMSALLNRIDTHVEIAYMAVSSYKGGIRSSGDLKITYDLEIPVKDRDILIIEDIVDTGLTLSTVIQLLYHRGAKSVKIATMLDKPLGRKVDLKPDYIGKTIPKVFVVGFGLDYQELYRNLPYVGILKPTIYEK